MFQLLLLAQGAGWQRTAHAASGGKVREERDLAALTEKSVPKVLFVSVKGAPGC